MCGLMSCQRDVVENTIVRIDEKLKIERKIDSSEHFMKIPCDGIALAQGKFLKVEKITINGIDVTEDYAQYRYKYYCTYTKWEVMSDGSWVLYDSAPSWTKTNKSVIIHTNDGRGDVVYNIVRLEDDRFEYTASGGVHVIMVSVD